MDNNTDSNDFTYDPSPLGILDPIFRLAPPFSPVPFSCENKRVALIFLPALCFCRRCHSDPTAYAYRSPWRLVGCSECLGIAVTATAHAGILNFNACSKTRWCVRTSVKRGYLIFGTFSSWLSRLSCVRTTPAGCGSLRTHPIFRRHC